MLATADVVSARNAACKASASWDAEGSALTAASILERRTRRADLGCRPISLTETRLWLSGGCRCRTTLTFTLPMVGFGAGAVWVWVATGLSISSQANQPP